MRSPTFWMLHPTLRKNYSSVSFFENQVLTSILCNERLNSWHFFDVSFEAMKPKKSRSNSLHFFDVPFEDMKPKESRSNSLYFLNVPFETIKKTTKNKQKNNIIIYVLGFTWHFLPRNRIFWQNLKR